ncbi:MAG: DNA-binding protein [Deltaproteobacteria bacterium]|nr:DNA-binding protein [Deltaproteobacteria bacterium]
MKRQSNSEQGTVTRKLTRSRKRTRARSRTIALRRLTREEIRRKEELKDFEYEKPTTRSECRHGLRPCPFVSCKYHLYLDVKESGAIKLNFPDLDVWELEETCALDVAERGGVTLEEVGEILNLTRERIRQLEVRGLMKMRSHEDSDELEEYVE